jgi:hypothetical protein
VLKMADIKFEIKEELGVISEGSKGWKKEAKSRFMERCIIKA